MYSRNNQIILLLMSDKQVITASKPLNLLLDRRPLNLKLIDPQLNKMLENIPQLFTPPKPYLSPDIKKINSEKNIMMKGEVRANTDQGKTKKINHILFTIEENHYNRKNQNLLSPRPPKYRSPTQKLIPIPEPETSQRGRERRVVFTQNLIKEEIVGNRRQSLTTKPIIRNSVMSSSQVTDNLSNSSRSISVQNSFISQLKSVSKQRPKIDNNKQKYAQMMSHFQKNKDNKVSKPSLRSAKLAKQLKEEKYTDNIFPPLYSSLFLINARTNYKLGQQVKWKRLSQFEDISNIVLYYPQDKSKVRIIVDKKSFSTEFIAVAFNTIKHSPGILQRIFEQQVFNIHGLYLVRIFQQNNWKSVILDDFVPVRQSVNSQSGQTYPAFIDVKCPEGESMQIWPFLLQKAYANYYSAYQMLRFGNVIDFLTELMGLAPLQINIRKRSQKQLASIQQRLQVADSIAIGETSDQKRYYVIHYTQHSQRNMLMCSEYPQFKDIALDHHIFSKLRKIFIFSPKIYHTLSTATIGKYSPTHSNHERAEYSLRKLIVSQPGECIISLQQKQRRFFVKSSLNYSYLWIRILLVQRQYNGYRWIEGNYSNQKSIVFNQTLSQGQYYLLIMPEWKQSHNFQLTLLVWGNHHVVIEREKSSSCEEMIQQASMDLAQRKGKVNQLTNTLCSYNYLCPRTGLIIQNINNQKLKEEVKVHRNISGIPCSVALLPVNRIFWETKTVFNPQIDIIIPKLSSFTIVLKMRGGMDGKLIRLFASEKESSGV